MSYLCGKDPKAEGAQRVLGVAKGGGKLRAVERHYRILIVGVMISDDHLAVGSRMEIQESKIKYGESDRWL